MISDKNLLCVLVIFGLKHSRGQEFDTTNGRVRGETISVLGKSLDVFYGIPFAKPPVGDLRFKHPKAAKSWSPEVKNATVEMPSCIQSVENFANFPVDEFFVRPNDFSEDCLYLNVWKPSSASNGSNLAVMIWIYGGAYAIGSIRIPAYNGQYLAAENNVIVVSISYRLGPLGFGFLGSDTIPGNMGLLDQVEGMKWVKDNVANFGGDINRITIFGESAGAFSVGFHLLSPLTKNLFKYAVLQSGSPIRGADTVVQTQTEAMNNMKKLSEAMKCSGSTDADIYKCLKAADSKTITTGADKLSATGVTFYPVDDGYYLPDNPLNMMTKGEYKKTNILTGVTKDEITLFFYFFLEPINKTFVATGEEFNYGNFQFATTLLTGLTDMERMTALKSFYESEVLPPLDNLEILNHLGSDFTFKCPALQFSSFYTNSNDVYMYSLNHRISNMLLPEWMGVPHGYDIPLVFGLPLNDSLGYTDEEKELSRNIMTYWSNFAKSGDPNSPAAVTASWPVFNKQNQTYKVLDVGSNLATKHGFRHHQCDFINDILPMIPKDENINATVIPTPGTNPCVNGGRRQCPGWVYMILSLLTVSFWMLGRQMVHGV